MDVRQWAAEKITDEPVGYSERRFAGTKPRPPCEMEVCRYRWHVRAGHNGHYVLVGSVVTLNPRHDNTYAQRYTQTQTHTYTNSVTAAGADMEETTYKYARSYIHG